MRCPECSTPVETHVFFRFPDSGALLRAQVISVDGEVYALEILRDAEIAKLKADMKQQADTVMGLEQQLRPAIGRHPSGDGR